MKSTFAPHAVQKVFSRSTAFGFAFSGGVKMHQRLWNRSANPASGPEYSVPAIGWPGMRSTPSGMWGATSRTTACLTEPTSVTMAPGASTGPISCAMRGAGADGDAQHDQIGTGGGARGGLVHGVAQAQFHGPVAGGLGPGMPGDMAGKLFPAHDMGQRGADEAEADQRDPLEGSIRGHQTAPLMKSCKAATSARLASSEPIEARRAPGRP
jgi:hypothetical protein